MLSGRRALAVLGIIIPWSVATMGYAQVDEQQKLLSRRSAEADCYRKLAETIKGLQINSQTYVRDFVTESDVIQAELDAFIRGVRLGSARYFEDGMCEVDAEVTVSQVVEHLREIHTRHYQGGRIVGTDFEKMEQGIAKRVIKVTGSGAPRADLPPDLPLAVEELLSPAPPAPRSSPYPEIWRTVPAQGKLMAVQAARMDAQRKLLERIMGVRINSNTLVRDFVTQSDEIEAQASDMVIGCEETKRYYHHDELIVEVTMSVPTEQVMRTISEFQTRHRQGDRVTGEDVVRVQQKTERKTFSATGSGVPPRAHLESATRATGVDMPEWALGRISAQGEGTDGEIDTPQGRLRAIQAATLDARRKLIEQIYGLQVTAATHVRDFVLQRDEINAQLNSMIAGSVVEDREVRDAVAIVVVSVGGPEIWSPIRSQWLVESRR